MQGAKHRVWSCNTVVCDGEGLFLHDCRLSCERQDPCCRSAPRLSAPTSTGLFMHPAAISPQTPRPRRSSNVVAMIPGSVEKKKNTGGGQPLHRYERVDISSPGREQLAWHGSCVPSCWNFEPGRGLQVRRVEFVPALTDESLSLQNLNQVWTNQCQAAFECWAEKHS
jgi:hypothetical protein